MDPGHFFIASAGWMPEINISPDSGVSTPSKMSMRVDLPDPDAPTIATVCPDSTLKLMSFIA